MTTPRRQPERRGGVTGFRWKLLAAVGLVVTAVTALGIYAAGRNASVSTENAFEHEFEIALASLHHVQEMRYAEIAGRCDALVRNPRIHAALEDDALDLLYFNARDQLHDLVYGKERNEDARNPNTLRATFYRFLDAKGSMISPPNDHAVGVLTTLEQKQLAVNALPDKQQICYLVRTAGDQRGTVNEVITVPIVSSETGEIISALMVGFEPVNLNGSRAAARITSGIWLNDTLYVRGFDEKATAQLGAQVTHVIKTVDGPERQFTVTIERAPYLVFYKKLNPDSIFPPAYEVYVYPLAESHEAQRQLRWQIAGAGGLVLLGGLLASHLVSRRFAAPVEQLAFDSAENLAQRARVEAALETTSRDLQRSVRFSADASHQLKTPVTVLRAGLEELLTQDHLSAEMRDGVSELVHQTYRLNNVIEDLLLLSRMDSGRLQLEVGAVDLVRLIEAWLDDLSVLPDPLDLEVEADLPSQLCIAGEKRYTTLIVQNLLENARKYNRAGGRVQVTARRDAQGGATFTVGNTGRTIAPSAREHIFERFHRGSFGEDVPGHGLGLNLARELARLHGGDLRLVRSENDWTEFEVTFRLAASASLCADTDTRA